MMKTGIAVLMFCLALPSAQADETPVSDASLKELLEVTHAHSLLDSVMGQVEASMQKSMAQAMAGQPMTPEQQAILDDFRHRTVDMIKDSLSWDTMEPIYMEAYRRSFTQQEMNGMLAFYTSEAGRAVIAKLPLVIQNIMQITNERMTLIMPKIQQLQQDLRARLEATQPPAASTN
jgi:hypothetical protein